MPYKFVRDDVIRDKELSQLLDCLSEEDWLRSLVAFLYLSGCRISEALALRKEDFKAEGEHLFVNVRILKQRRKRLGPIEDRRMLCIKLENPLVKPILARLSQAKGGERLWPYTRQMVWVRLKRLSDVVSPHVFRHSRLTLLAEAGADPFELQAWAGWSDVRPASGYVHRSAKMMKEIAGKI